MSAQWKISGDHRPCVALHGFDHAPGVPGRSALDFVVFTEGGVILQASCGYLELAVNWITHVEALGITNWLTIAEDETALRFLEARYPGHVVRRSAFFEEAVSGTGLYEWSSASFAQAACVRPVYLEMVLDLGYEVLWSDMDTAWLQPFFQLAPAGLDYVGVDDSDAENEQETDNASTGLMYFRPTERSQQLLLDWHAQCQDQISISNSIRNSQGAFNRALFAAAAVPERLNFNILPKQLYPHGALIEQLGYKHGEEAAVEAAFDPAWVHANHRVGHAEKKDFLRESAVWAEDDGAILVPLCPA
ncbi:g5202 [Coccomyxa elongata]